MSSFNQSMHTKKFWNKYYQILKENPNIDNGNKMCEHEYISSLRRLSNSNNEPSESSQNQNNMARMTVPSSQRVEHNMPKFKSDENNIPRMTVPSSQRVAHNMPKFKSDENNNQNIQNNIPKMTVPSPRMSSTRSNIAYMTVPESIESIGSNWEPEKHTKKYWNAYHKFINTTTRGSLSKMSTDYISGQILRNNKMLDTGNKISQNEYNKLPNKYKASVFSEFN